MSLFVIIKTFSGGFSYQLIIWEAFIKKIQKVLKNFTSGGGRREFPKLNIFKCLKPFGVILNTLFTPKIGPSCEPVLTSCCNNIHFGVKR